MTCRSREDRQLRSFWEPSTAEVAILAFLHVGGQVCANPTSLAINDALFLELSDSRLPTLDRSRMVRIFRRLRIPGFRDGNRLHCPYFSSVGHFALSVSCYRRRT